MQYDGILKNNIEDLSSIYLIYGDDKYLIDEFIDKFVEKFVSEDFKDFNLNFLEENDSLVTTLINAVKTLPFMAPKRIVVVKTYDLFSKKPKDGEQLYKLIGDFPDSTILLLLSYNKPNKRLKLFKEIKKSGEILKFEGLKYKKLDQWIENKVRDLGWDIDKRGVKLLEEAFNNDLLTLDSELNKVMAFVGEKKFITKEDIEMVISKDWLIKENIIFDFVDAIGKRDTSMALNLLSDILREGSDPKQILGMIARQIRLMLQSKLLSNKGFSAEQISKKLKQHIYPIKKCLRQSNNFSIEALERALERIFEADCNLVTGAERELEMELLVIGLNRDLNEDFVS
ncbi:DNA polymerase III subunit delta [Halonatronum saccharophilum]|uniref:DNA polymerase III subunit delta n=1 Tax=Halonatronum saccharophilum TaxID=150060 RepID=UPI00048847B7|nr:DNA polymerase III subunit delta [Halonatronum saccharophilum]